MRIDAYFATKTLMIWLIHVQYGTVVLRPHYLTPSLEDMLPTALLPDIGKALLVIEQIGLSKCQHSYVYYSEVQHLHFQTPRLNTGHYVVCLHDTITK